MMGDAQPTVGSGVSLVSLDTRKLAVPQLLTGPSM
jgi:hypothetical protein